MPYFNWARWLRSFFRRPRGRGYERKPRRRLTLEQLETRLAPATYIWQGGSGGSFNTGANWQGGMPPTGNGDDLVFPALATPQTLTNNIPNAVFNSMTFSGSNYILQKSQPFTLGSPTSPTSGFLHVTAGNTDTINDPFILGGAAGSRQFITADFGATLVISGQISSNNFINLTKEGAGTLELDNPTTSPNTFTGAMTIDQSAGIVLAFSTTQPFGMTTNQVTVGQNSQLQMYNSTIANPLIINGPGINSGGALLAVNTQTSTMVQSKWTGPIVMDTDTTYGANVNAILDVTGSIGDSGAGHNVIITSAPASVPGTVIFASANTYRGNTTINNGTLEVQNDFSLGNNSSGNFSVTVNQNLLGAGTLELQSPQGAQVPTAGSGTLGALGPNDPTPPGLVMQKETLILNGAGSAGATSGGAVIDPLGRGALYNDVGNNVWTGNVILGSPDPNGADVSIGVNGLPSKLSPNTDLTISGTISDVSGVPAPAFPLDRVPNLTKILNGRLIFAPANIDPTTNAAVKNTYQGNTTVAQGILDIRDSNALGKGTNPVIVAAGATLELEKDSAVDPVPDSVTKATNSLNVSRLLVLDGAGIFGLGALYSAAGINIYSGNIIFDTTSSKDDPVGEFNFETGIGVAADPIVANWLASGMTASSLPFTYNPAGYFPTYVTPNAPANSPITTTTVATSGDFSLTIAGVISDQVLPNIMMAPTQQQTQLGGLPNPFLVPSSDFNGSPTFPPDTVTPTPQGTGSVGLATSATESGTTVTLTFLSPPAAGIGSPIVVSGFLPAGYNSPPNGSWTVTSVVGNTLTYTDTTTGLTAGSLYGSVQINGAIPAFQPATALDKLGLGQLILSPTAQGATPTVTSNTYEGPTNIEAGWITVQSTGALGQPLVGVGPNLQPPVTVFSGAALHVKPLTPGTNLTLTNNFVLAGLGISDPYSLINQQGALENLGGNNILSGLIQLRGQDTGTGTGAGIGVQQLEPIQFPSELTVTNQISDWNGVVDLARHANLAEAEDDALLNFADANAPSGTIDLFFYLSGLETLQVFDPPFPASKAPVQGGSITPASTFPQQIPYSGAGDQVELVMDQNGLPTGVTWAYQAQVIVPTPGPGELVKLGPNRLTLQGPGTYSGGVDIRQGVLRDMNNTGLGAPGGGNVTVESGAALELAAPTAQENGGIVTGIQVWDTTLVLNGPGYSGVAGAFTPSGLPNLPPEYPLTNSSGTDLFNNALSGDNVWRGPIVLGNQTPNVFSVNFEVPGPQATMTADGSGLTGSTSVTVVPATVGFLPSNDAVQTITFGSSVNGGTFTLTYNGVTTAPIPYSANAGTLDSSIQTALNAIIAPQAAAGSGITITNGGSGYTTAPSVIFTGGGAGSGAAGTATINAAGQVTGVTITNQGSGYTSPPTVSFSGGGGSGATAVASVNGFGQISTTVTISFPATFPAGNLPVVTGNGANLLGVNPSVNVIAGANTDTITFGGTVTGGTFTLTFTNLPNGAGPLTTTGTFLPIPWSANSATLVSNVQKALNALLGTVVSFSPISYPITIDVEPGTRLSLLEPSPTSTNPNPADITDANPKNPDTLIMTSYDPVNPSNTAAGELVLGGNNAYNGTTLIGVGIGGSYNLPNGNAIMADGSTANPVLPGGIVTLESSNALGATGTTEVENLTVSGTTGAYTLTFNGATTGALPVSATAAQVQAALNALPSVLGVNGFMTVTSSGSVFTVTFGGSLLGTNEPQITAIGSGGATVATSIPPGDGGGGGTVVSDGYAPANIPPSTLQIQGSISIGGEPLTIQGAGAGSVPSSIPLTWLPVGPSASASPLASPVDNGLTLGTNLAPVSGSVTGVAVDPSDPSTIYIASNGGGAWKTVNDGISWVPIFDNPLDAATDLPINSEPNPGTSGGTITPVGLYIGAIAIDPNNPEIIYLGTGTHTHNSNSWYGTGVYQSLNGGGTWNLLVDSSLTNANNPTGNVNPFYGAAITSIAVAPAVNPLAPLAAPTGNFQIYVSSSNQVNTGPGALPGAAGIWSFTGNDSNPTGSGTNTAGGSWSNLTFFTSFNRANTPGAANNTPVKGGQDPPPLLPGPDDDYRINFPDSSKTPNVAATWSDVALGPSALGGPNNGELYAALGTPQGGFGVVNPGPIAAAVVNGVYHMFLSTPGVWFAGGPGTVPVTIGNEYLSARNGQGNGPDQEFKSAFPVDPTLFTLGNIKIATTAGFASPDTIYALVAQSTNLGVADGAFDEIEVSNDGGQTWAAASAPVGTGSFGNQTMAIATLPYDSDFANLEFQTNPAVVAVGWSNGVWVSTSAGGAWTNVTIDGSGNGPGMGVQALRFDYPSAKTARLVAGTTQGIWRLNAPLTSAFSWSDLNANPKLLGNGNPIAFSGLSLAEVNSVSPDQTTPTAAYAGVEYDGVLALDNNPAWTQVATTSNGQGSGETVQINPQNNSIVYFELEGSNNGPATLDQGVNSPGVPVFSVVPTPPFGPLSPLASEMNIRSFPFVEDSIDANRLLVGGETLPGDTSTIRNLSLSDTTPVANAVLAESFDGGQTFSNLAGNLVTYGFAERAITSIAIATFQGTFAADANFPLVVDKGANTYDPDTIYVTGGTSIFVTKNDGTSWAMRSLPGGSLPNGAVITSLVVDPRNRDTIYATSNAFGANQVFVSTTAGRSWAGIGGGLPQVPVWKLVVDPRNGNLYAGTDDGVWDLPSGPNGTTGAGPWVQFGVGMPDVAVHDLQLNQNLNTLTAGTYGRGVYQLSLPDPATIATGALRAISGAAVWTGPVILDGNTTIAAGGSQQLLNGVSTAKLTIVGPISDAIPGGNFTLTKQGLGDIILAGTNTYGGITDVAQGNLVVDNPQALGAAGTPDIQTVTVTGNTGTFELEFINSAGNSQATVPIAWNAPAAQVAADLDALSNIGGAAADVNVTLGMDSSGDEVYTISFLGSLNGFPQSQMLAAGFGGLLNPTVAKVQNGSGGTIIRNGAALVLQTSLDLEPVQVNGIGVLPPFNGHATGAFRNESAQNQFTGTLILNANATVGVDSGGELVIGGSTYTLTFATPGLQPTVVAVDVTATGAATLTGTNPSVQVTQTSPGALPNINGVDTIAFGGSITGGTFELQVTFNNLGNLVTLTTPPIVYPPSTDPNRQADLAANIMAALNSLTPPTVAAGASSSTETLTFPALAQPTMTASGAGLTGSVPTVSVTPPVGGQSTITFGGAITGGTFTLTVDGLTTSAIFWSPNQSTLVANIQAALNALTGQLVGNQVAFQGAATVTDAGNNFGLTKEGTGTLVLGSANTYTGNTIINQGAVNVQNNTGLGNGAETQVLYGAQLQLQGGITVGQNELLRISGTGAAGSGALENISGANFWEGNVILAQDLYVLLQANGQPTTNPQLTSPTAAIASSAPTVAIGALPGGPDDKLTIDGVISDSGLTSPLAIVDANPPAPGTTALDNTTSPAVVVFTNSNTYDGGTTVSIGSILRIQNGKSLGTGNTSVQVGGTLQVDGDPAGTGNSISVPANITLAGAGVNVLGTQTLTVTGPLTNGQIPPAPSSYTLTLPAYTLSGALVPASATANPILLTATAAQVQAALAALPSLTAVGGTVAVTQSTNLQNETVYTIMFQGATGEPLNLPLLMPVAIPGVSVTASYVSAGALENISGNNTWSGSVTLGVANPDFVAGVTITNGGSGYSASAPPTVTFSGGGGSGATGTAVVNAAGQVVAVNLTPVTGGGTLYTSAPTVTFSGGGGSGAAGNAFLQGDFIGVDLQPGSTAQTQLTITGAIADPTSPTGPPFADLTKVGQGILVFPNKNNYHGNTFITGGDLNIQNSQALGTSTQEVQAVTEVGPASGTFSITFNGYTTPSIPENATAAQVQAALDALPSIAGVGAFVLVSETNAGPAGNMYQFAFFGPLDGYAEPQVSVSGTPGMIVTSAIVTAGDGATFVYPGASLQLQGNINVGSTPLTLYGGSGYGGNGALENVENTNTWSNIIVLGGNASIGVTDKTFQNDVLHITQPIVDISENSSFGVTKVGPGTLDYQAQNLYTGLTQVNAGTLLLDNSSGAPSLSGNLAIGSGVAGPSAIAQWRDSNQLTPAPQVLSTSPTTYTVTFQLPGAQNALTANTSNLTGTNTNVPPAARTVPGSFPSTDEVQTITFSPTITGGTFTLTYVNPITSQSQTTLPITWSANPATLAANIATALNVLLGPIVTVNGGGVMDLNGKTETVGTLNIVDGEATTDASGATGTGMLTAGSLNMVSGIFDVQNGGQLVLDGNVTATSDVNNSPTVSAVITGPGTVSLNGLTRTFTTVDPSGNNGSGAPLVTVGSVANTYTVAFQSPGPVTMSANPSGLTGPAPTLNVTTTATGALPATDALETITFGGTITGGTFTLTVNGSTTAPIAWNATAATLAANIQAALNALASATQPVDLDVQSAIIGTGSEGLIKAGNGTMEVDNINPYTGGTQINAGDLQVDGTIGNVVLDGGSLSGSGFVGNVVSTAVSPALDTINPGDNTSPATDTGILTANNVTLGAQSVLWVDLLLGNQVPGAGFYDQLVVNGNTGINLGNATLTGTSALNINVGDSFVIIQIPQTASGTITGTFANPNNTVFLSGAKFKITYSPTVNPTEVILTKESANVSLSVAAVPTTSVFGQPVTITATFTPEAGASASLAGDPVNFVFDDGTPNANTVQGSIGANNQAILNTNGLAVGSHTVYVTFPGDSSYNPVSSQSSPTPFTVNQSTSKVTVTQDVASPVYGQTVDITATITGQFNYVNTINVSNGGSGYSPATQVTISGGGGSGATATATISGGQIVAITVTNPGSGYASTPTVTISDSGGGTGAAATAVLAAGATGTATFTINGTPFAGGPVTLDSNGQAQIPLSTVNAGAAQIKVSYSGDGNFKPSSSTYTLSIQKDGSTAQGSSTPSSTNFGQPVTLTATLSANAPGSGTPTGSVTFYDGPVANNIVLGTGTLSSGTATISTSTLTPGNHTITLAYNGDSNFKVTTGTFSYTVSKNGSVTTLLSPVPVSPVSGQPVTFTATVAAQPPASGKPTGTVTFLVNGNPLTPAATLSSADQATFTDSSLTAGSYTITAMYNSDSNFATSTSSPLNLNVGVAASKTTVTASQTTAVFGQALNITATVSAVSPGTGTPVGTADFFVDGSPVATGVPVVNGQAVLNTSTLQLPIPVSSTPHTITVNFNDSDTFFSNSSGTLTGGLTVNQATPTVGVTSLPNPSVFGQDVTFTITVGAASPGSGTPGGNVDVVIDGTAVASALPLVNGQTTFDTSSLTVGTHRVVINFHDTDGNFTSGSGLLTGGQVVTKASATASIFSSGNPSVFGQPVTFTANLNTVSGTPTGFVTFIVDGQAQAPAVAVNGGQANLVLSNLPPGMHQVSAAYAGDTNFNPVSTDMPVQVSGNGTSETVTFQGPGVQAQMSAVSSLTGTNPTVAVATTTPGALPSTAAVQTITFGGTITGGTFTLTEGTATTAAINWDPSAVNLTTNIQSALNALALTQTVNQAATTTALSASANPSGFGQPVTFTAAVTGNSPSQGVPTSGQVMFSIDNGAIQQMVTVNSQGKANFTISSLAQGTPHTVVATFLGNVDYAASAASNTLTQTILQSSITTVASSLNPSTYGQSVTFTATVAPGAGASGTPTGTVTFSLDNVAQAPQNLNGGTTVTFTPPTLAAGPHTVLATYNGGGGFAGSSAGLTETVKQDGTNTSLSETPSPSATFGQAVTFTASVTAAAPGSGTPTGTATFTIDGVQTPETLTNGVATFSASSLNAVTHTVSVAYGGDTNFSASNSGAAANYVVNKSGTTTTLNATPSSPAFGQTVTFTATVAASGSGSGTPTGSVTFVLDNISSQTTTVSLNSSGQATVSYAALTAGNHSVTATYVPGANFLTSPSATASVTVGKANTNVSLSENPTSTVFGQALTLTANVANTSTFAIPTGTVQFSIDSGAQVLSATLNASGQATVAISSLSAATHTIVANYQGTTTFAANSSTQASYTVSAASTKTTVSASPNPATPGQAVTFTAAVLAQTPGSGTPAGQVTFFVDGSPVQTVNVSNGKATFSTSSLGTGTHAITASYNDNVDSNYLGSSSSNSVSEKIASNSKTTLKSSKTSPTQGQTVKFTATVTSPGATGSVTFFVDGVNMGTFSLNGSGQAIFSTASLKVGKHTIKAVYSGDSTYNSSNASVSVTVFHVVGRRL